MKLVREGVVEGQVSPGWGSHIRKGIRRHGMVPMLVVTALWVVREKTGKAGMSLLMFSAHTNP